MKWFAELINSHCVSSFTVEHPLLRICFVLCWHKQRICFWTLQHDQQFHEMTTADTITPLRLSWYSWYSLSREQKGKNWKVLLSNWLSAALCNYLGTEETSWWSLEEERPFLLWYRIQIILDLQIFYLPKIFDQWQHVWIIYGFFSPWLTFNLLGDTSNCVPWFPELMRWCPSPAWDFRGLEGPQALAIVFWPMPIIQIFGSLCSTWNKIDVW